MTSAPRRSCELSTAGEPVADAAPSSQRDRRYLLVLEAGSSSLVALPPVGHLTLGRAKDADVRITEPAASRQHARLMLTPAEARIEDLNSQNGTYVNGERLVGSRLLTRGDVVSIGDVALVFHRGVHRARGPAFLDEESLRRRLDEEIERSRTYARSASLLCLEFPKIADRPRTTAILAERLRLLDASAWGGPRRLWVVLPELAEADALDLAGRLLEGIAPLDPDVRLGLASCPGDGTDADTLLTGARLAAEAAQPGQLRVAAEGVTHLEIAGRDIVIVEPTMIRLFGLVERLARSELPILVCGETGTGKEIVASTVHDRSTRVAGRFVSLNCAALQDTLIESELFGYERGAFSGATAAKPGLLESANGGTVFLDEVGELSPMAQAKLLRAIETRSIMRLGDVKTRTIDIRIVAATNRDLVAEVKAGRFREDLYFRLSAATIVLPPLRDRRRELPVLARKFLADASARHQRPAAEISPSAMDQLIEHTWPGNVRELRNVMEYVAVTLPGCVVEPWHLPAPLGATALRPLPIGLAPNASPAAPDPSGKVAFRPIAQELHELERQRMAEALAASNGVMAKAAELIGMPVRTFFHKHKQYGLPSARRDPSSAR